MRHSTIIKYVLLLFNFVYINIYDYVWMNAERSCQKIGVGCFGDGDDDSGEYTQRGNWMRTDEIIMHNK